MIKNEVLVYFKSYSLPPQKYLIITITIIIMMKFLGLNSLYNSRFTLPRTVLNKFSSERILTLHGL